MTGFGRLSTQIHELKGHRYQNVSIEDYFMASLSHIIFPINAYQECSELTCKTYTPTEIPNTNLFHSYDLHLHICILHLRNNNSSSRRSKRQLPFINHLKVCDTLITIPEINLPEIISKKKHQKPIQ
jgi:hypothetical protein